MHLSVARVLDMYECMVCLLIHVQVVSDCKNFMLQLFAWVQYARKL